jgi:hypothetical protein
MMRYKKIPGLKQIIEKRGVWGKFRVYLSYSLIWTTLIDRYFGSILGVIISDLSDEGIYFDRELVNGLSVLLTALTAVVVMHFRMKKRAEERWQWKYDSNEVEGIDD